MENKDKDKELKEKESKGKESKESKQSINKEKEKSIKITEKNKDKDEKELKEVKDNKETKEPKESKDKTSSKGVNKLNTEISKDGKEVNTIESKQSKKEVKDTKEPSTKKTEKELTSKKNNDSTDNKNTDSNNKKLIQSLTQDNELLKLKLEEQNLQINQQQCELLASKKTLQESEKTIAMLSSSNKKLLTALDELKKEIDEKVEKISIKQISEKMRQSQSKQNPLEVVLKVREKEIKNSSSMIESLRKDKEELEKKLTFACDYKNMIALQDKLKHEEKRNSELMLEIKTLSKRNEDCQRVSDNINAFDNEKKQLSNDIMHAKEQIKELKKKLLKEELCHSETKDKLITIKRENDELKRFLNKTTEEKDKDKDNNSNKDKRSPSQSKTKHIKTNPQVLQHTNTKKSLSIRDSINNKELDHLFTPEELIQLEKNISKEDLDRYSRKYDALLHSKNSLESKHNLLNRKTTLEKAEFEEKLEYITIQLKESDQKSKILSYQVNEYKSEAKSNLKRLQEALSSIEIMKASSLEKEQENRLLVSQLQQLRKLTKHNALTPIDSEITKKVERIREEEQLTPVPFSDNLIDIVKLGLEFDVFTLAEEGRDKAWRVLVFSVFTHGGVLSILKQPSFDCFIEEIRQGYINTSCHYHNVSYFI